MSGKGGVDLKGTISAEYIVEVLWFFFPTEVWNLLTNNSWFILNTKNITEIGKVHPFKVPPLLVFLKFNLCVLSKGQDALPKTRSQKAA